MNVSLPLASVAGELATEVGLDTHLSPPAMDLLVKYSSKLIDVYEQSIAAGNTKRRVDMVNNPPHYNAGSIECIEAIRSALTKEEFRGYCKGNALKYVWREAHKGGNESLQKAVWYLNKTQE